MCLTPNPAQACQGEEGVLPRCGHAPGDPSRFRVTALEQQKRSGATPCSRLLIDFSDTERGREICDLYDSGTGALFESGRLEEIDSSYGILTPTITPRS